MIHKNYEYEAPTNLIFLYAVVPYTKTAHKRMKMCILVANEDETGVFKGPLIIRFSVSLFFLNKYGKHCTSLMYKHRFLQKKAVQWYTGND